MFMRILKYLLIGLVNGSKLWIDFYNTKGLQKNHALPGDNEIKKMSMFRRQVCMADDNEFDHIVTYVMFVYGTYVLEGAADAIFSLGDLWNSFQGDTLPNNASNFCRQMISCMKAWNYLQKTLDLSLNTKISRQTHGLIMDNENDVLEGECRKSSAFAGYHIFVSASHIERYMEDAILKFYETKKDDPMMVAANLFGNIINTHPFEDGN